MRVPGKGSKVQKGRVSVPGISWLSPMGDLLSLREALKSEGPRTGQKPKSQACCFCCAKGGASLVLFSLLDK